MAVPLEGGPLRLADLGVEPQLGLGAGAGHLLMLLGPGWGGGTGPPPHPSPHPGCLKLPQGWLGRWMESHVQGGSVPGVKSLLSSGALCWAFTWNAHPFRAGAPWEVHHVSFLRLPGH